MRRLVGQLKLQCLRS